MSDSQRGDDLTFAKHLADVAAAITTAGFGGRLPVEFKDDASPVTVLDGAAEQAIKDEVAKHRPDDSFVGEEYGHHIGTNNRTWVVDPIDGTQMFAEGLPLWTTLIALREDDAVVLAVADAPALNNRYHSFRGEGAYCNDEPIHVSDVPVLGESFVLHAPIEEFARGSGIDALQRIVANARASRGIGDALAHLFVAQGSADALVEQGPCFEWDYAATSLIVSEAGGALTQLDGSPPIPGCHLLVTNGHLAAELQASL